MDIVVRDVEWISSLKDRYVRNVVGDVEWILSLKDRYVNRRRGRGSGYHR